eukprot:scaffold8795_cov116-Isochrysis_galbana.AAC.3
MAARDRAIMLKSIEDGLDLLQPCAAIPHGQNHAGAVEQMTCRQSRLTRAIFAVEVMRPSRRHSHSDARS